MVFDGKPTDTTKKLKGWSQNEAIRRLRGEIEQLKIHNAALRENNILLESNQEKYMDKMLSPTLKKIIQMFESQKSDVDMLNKMRQNY